MKKQLRQRSRAVKLSEEPDLLEENFSLLIVLKTTRQYLSFYQC